MSLVYLHRHYFVKLHKIYIADDFLCVCVVYINLRYNFQTSDILINEDFPKKV